MRDESLEVIRDQYEQKNMVLAQFGEQVSAWTLYEDIYPMRRKAPPFRAGDIRRVRRICASI